MSERGLFARQLSKCEVEGMVDLEEVYKAVNRAMEGKQTPEMSKNTLSRTLSFKPLVPRVSIISKLAKLFNRRRE